MLRGEKIGGKVVLLALLFTVSPSYTLLYLRSLLGGKVVRSHHRHTRSVEDTFEDQPKIFMLTSLLDMGLQSVLESLQSLQG